MKKQFYSIFLLAMLILTCSWLSQTLYQRAAAQHLSVINAESDFFREQRLTEKGLQTLQTLEEQSLFRPGELMMILSQMQSGSISLPLEKCSPTVLLKWKSLFLQYNSAGYDTLSEAYGAIWDDVQSFPVYAEGVFFENSWMFERNYGGKRGHEGTDLMPPENIAGHYPIVSMTDGIVEKIGWLPMGGYRIGIRAPSGGYFYYAHLSSYSDDFQIGDEVRAGTVLGVMGDTGYGPEGTRGKFDVHLHLGIYIRTEDTPELSVNPYWVLRYLQGSSKGSVASSG